MEFLSSFGNWCGGSGMWHGGGTGWQGFMPFHFGSIFQILIIGLIIYFIVNTIRKRTPASTNGPPSPHDILKRRYAAGEIDKATFDRMKDELK